MQHCCRLICCRSWSLIYMFFFEGIMKSLLITWWILSLSLSLSLLGRQNVPWTATHFVALGRQCMQGATKCAVKAARFVVDDKLCRGDKMCRNNPPPPPPTPPPPPHPPPNPFTDTHRKQIIPPNPVICNMNICISLSKVCESLPIPLATRTVTRATLYHFNA